MQLKVNGMPYSLNAIGLDKINTLASYLVKDDSMEEQTIPQISQSNLRSRRVQGATHKASYDHMLLQIFDLLLQRKRVKDRAWEYLVILHEKARPVP